MPHIAALLARYGYLAVLTVVAAENLGVPLPGETMLVAAAVYAGTTHQLRLPLVIAAASIGAVAGGQAGFLVGRRVGYQLVVRYGRYLHLDRGSLRLGQYLFLKHGGAIVFAGRFIALLRAVTALLAGINRMDAARFAIFNAVGAVAWAAAFGAGGYLLGERLERASTTVATIVAVAVAAGVVFGWKFVRRHEGRLRAEADAALGSE